MVDADIVVAKEPPTIRPLKLHKASLVELCEAVSGALVGESNTTVSGVSLVAKKVKAGDLFVAVRGEVTHGANYLPEATRHGAVAVLTDREGAQIIRELDADIPIIVVENPRLALPEIARIIYDYHSEKLPTLLGITGTNGKTSTVHILDGMLVALGTKSGLSSTAERRVGKWRGISGLTTPEVSDLIALVAAMQEKSVEYAAIEVSAQALTRHRVDGLFFDVVGFSNLSHDHLDDYGDMQTYLEAKLELFTITRARVGVVCLDSEWGHKVVESSEIPVVTVSSDSGTPADWNVKATNIDRYGTEYELTGPGGKSLKSSVPVIGEHMALNAALAVAMLVESGIDFQKIKETLEKPDPIMPVPGRTENVSASDSPAIYVDFAHTPDAFAKTLKAIREVTPGRIIMVFGVSGDRDASKRYDMSKEAVNGSEVVIITDHQPRTEDAASIRKVLYEAALDVNPSVEIYEIVPPEDAVRKAVSLATAEDSIFWAGPGHQNYREIMGVKHSFSARQSARDALVENGWHARPWSEGYGPQGYEVEYN